ncbi:MAG: SpoIIE family protein phosphatase [Treponema sp.]|uniref:SpoIIE family protein phosphatase n=1 Tax=Treponema sp. TaxID=166 RepID=UPI0025E4087D|nr:SpoIIE family protein phosphatase [Treponema sp.]MBQ9281213.1 SpoIIE family protein phosphatase [Treponema sp.]
MSQKSQPKQSHISPLAIKLLLAAVAFGLLLFLIIVYMGYKHFSSVFTNQYTSMTEQFAHISASYISGEQISRYGTRAIADDEYNGIYQKLMEITNVADLDSIAVTVPEAIRYETQNYIFHTVNARYSDRIQTYSLGSPEYLLAKSKKSIINMKRLMQLGKQYTEYNYSRNEKGQRTGTVMTALPLRDQYNNIVAMLSVTKSVDEMIAVQMLYFRRIFMVALIVTLVFIFLYGISLWRMIIHPILLIKNETSFFASNNKLSGLLKKIKNHDEIGSLSHAFEDMSEQINRYISEVTSITAEKERISTELNLAAKIQLESLPKGYPAFPERKDFDLFASMSPAKEVGGDLYDYMLLDDDHLMLVVGDVSGKGVPAALFMMTAKTLLDSGAKHCLSPKEIFEATNNQLCKGNESDLFVTCWLGILAFSTGELRFVNAGHPYPVLCHEGDFSYVKTSPNFVLGGMEGIPYKEHSIKLVKGDRLFVYTDGVTEATDANKELFGEARLLAAMEKTGSMNAPDTLTSVRKDIDDFAGEAEQFDDITMLQFIW